MKVGDWVEVRSKEEIVRTLDSGGQLDGMPFMPEMFAFCGKQFRVYKRAHKTCDTVFPVRGRRVKNAVHLDTRCDGSAHGGCQAGCLLFWKEEWLKPIAAPGAESRNGDAAKQQIGAANACTEEAVWTHACVPDAKDGSPIYVCQATRLPYATTNLNWWEISQYIEDYTSGNVGLWRMFCGLVYSVYYNLASSRLRLERPMRWFYNVFHPLWRGTLYPRTPGKVPDGQQTPTISLNLQPGEWVRVKSHEEILRTINSENKNRGMYWDAELVPFCGGTYKVLKRVTRIIDEKTGRMQEMKNPCIILDSVFCLARYSDCRMFCPRAIYSWWREMWLERVEPARSVAAEAGEPVQLHSQPCASLTAHQTTHAGYLDASKSQPRHD